MFKQMDEKIITIFRLNYMLYWPYEFQIDKCDATKAAEKKMFGKLTRDVLEWHPDRVLCKRFNIPDPYPG